MPGIRQSRDYFPCLLCFGFEREMMWDSFTSASAMLDICSICTFAPGAGSLLPADMFGYPFLDSAALADAGIVVGPRQFPAAGGQ